MSAALRARHSRAAVGRHLAFAADGVRFVDAARAAAQPAIWVEAFRVAIASGRSVSEQVRACIREHVSQYSADDFAATEGERTQLRHLLTPRPGLHARLLDMQACGLLGALFPELPHLAPRPIREVFAARGGDRLLLASIRQLELLRQATDGVRARFAALLDDVQAPELLTLVLLLVDPGAAEVDHDLASIETAAPFAGSGVHGALDRLQLPDDAERTIEFLLDNRTAMTRMALHGDDADLDLTAGFVGRVGRDERLAMLTVLTAVSLDGRDDEPSRTWKDGLVWRLYVDSRQRLALGCAGACESARAALPIVLAGRPGDLHETELSRFVADLPETYFAMFGVASIFPHVRLLRSLDAEAAHVSLEQHGRVWRLTIATARRGVAFARAVGVLSHRGVQLHRGQTIPMPGGAALLVFEFSDGGLHDDPSATGDLRRLLELALKGDVDVGSLVHGPSNLPGPAHPPGVGLSWRAAADRTIVTIATAPDRLRLHCYRSVRTIVGEGCEVQVALVEPDDRIGSIVLHVTQGGQPVSAPWQALLERRLADELRPAA